METILDLTASGADHELLTSTEVDTRLRSGTLLAERPLESYLRSGEEPRYLLRNRSSGVEFETDGRTTALRPDDGYQALALVTDVRIYFVVGRESGDKTSEVALSEVVEAKQASGGFRTNTLVIETIDGRRWSFACRDDTSEVASFVDGLAQVWANAQRLADEAEDQLRTAREHLDASESDAAAGALDGVAETLETAVDRLCAAGDGACARIRDRAASLARELFDLEGPTYAHIAATAHATAQDAWREREYEAAAAAYDRAIDRYERAIHSYERALDSDAGASNRDDHASDRDEEGSGPNERSPSREEEMDRLGRRLAGAVREREILRVAPLADADTARRRARAVEDPETATERWDDVLDSYRRLLELEWDGEGRFVVGTGTVREQASAAATAAIDDYYEDGRRRLGYGDRFAVDGQEDRAATLYERAIEQFERAHQMASTTDSDRVEEIESALATAESRLDGHLPADLAGDEPPVTGTDTAPPTGTAGETPAGSGTADDDAPSVIGRIQSQKRDGQSAEGPVRDSGGTTPGSADGTTTNTELRRKLRELDGTAFTRLVADLWEAQGWSTTVFSATNQVVYDVVAMREEPEERRLLLWTEHRPDGSQLGPRTVTRCATARDSSQGADCATIVTNALLRTAAQQRAQELDVTVIDGSDLRDLVRFEEFVDRLDWGTTST
jgi:tetratricopeptide (TPR) repeat protein